MEDFLFKLQVQLLPCCLSHYFFMQNSQSAWAFRKLSKPFTAEPFYDSITVKVAT